MQNIFTCIQISNFKAKQAKNQKGELIESPKKLQGWGGAMLPIEWHVETKSRNIEK